MTEVDPVQALVREADFGRYAATLFAPADARPHLFALYAFDIEVARVADLVREPMPGELRLQWWRDALDNPERADVVSHPTARALHAAIAYGRLPLEALHGVIDARVDDLYDDPVPTLAELEARFGATCSAVLRLASLIAAGGRDPGGAEACGFGGVAQGMERALAAFGKLASRGQSLLPAELMAAAAVRREDLLAGRATPEIEEALARLRAHAETRLAEARAAAAGMEPAGLAALLPLALVEPALARTKGRDPFAPAMEISRWRTLLRLLRFSRKTPTF
ncbi:MAG: hypothetical protein DI565_11140 [Ancylobacter novellus]|uniref:Phytoene synthase n=1 Tax=Ancylobacter novellus TaxID=921 RepID=A0A2W5KGW8_ANCNO|nr:MAG: hypothetical protein DI565_11140 [Ancylobacter novellus]